MKKYSIFILLNLISYVSAYSQHHPEKTRFITSDISNFWMAYDSAVVDTSKAIPTIQSLYLIKGSYGLKVFDSLSIGGASNLANAILQHPQFYRSIRNNTLKIDRFKQQMRESFVKLLSLYPAAQFPDVYFLIGNLNSGGKSAKDALLIGAELFSTDARTVFDNIDSSFKKLLQSLSLKTIPQVVAHELIHYQQSYTKNDKDLLAYAIMEGSADFVGELISGLKPNTVMYTYGEQREQQLWKEFKNDMHGFEFKNWMYSPSRGNKPADLGYFIGYKIVQSYYTISRNKKKAIREILNVQDFSKFLADSKYCPGR